MSHFADEDSLNDAIERLVQERFGPNESPLDDETFGTEIFHYHDVRQVLAARDLMERLRSMSLPAEDTSRLAEELTELNRQVEGLRTILAAVRSDMSVDEAAAFLAREAFLTEAEAVRLRDVMELYSGALSRTGDADSVGYVETDDATVLRCITEELLRQYLEDLYQSRRWLQPVETLFDTGQIQDMFEGLGSGLEPKGLSRVFFDESRYVAAIDRFERLHEPFLADVSRVYLCYARILQNLADSETYFRSIAAETRTALDRLTHYDLVEWTAFGDARDFIVIIPASLRIMLGMLPSLPAAERSQDLMKAEALLETSNVPLVRPWIPMARWMRSELAEGAEREKLAASAFARVNELLAASALEKEPLIRLGAMTSLMILPAAWKYTRGDFHGAIEASAMAKSMAEAFIEQYQHEMRPTLEELQKEIISGEASPEEHAQLVSVRDSLLALLEGTKAIVFLADLTRLTSEAGLAETRGEFALAAQMYREAGEQEKAAFERVSTLMSVFVDKATAISRARQQGFQHEARAAYFNAMAMLNEGDRQLMDGEYAEANRIYADAKTSFSAAEELWSKELLRVSQSAGQAQGNPRDEMMVNASRARYCDAKIEISHAEQASAVLRRPLDASRHFDKAAYILAEALETSLAKESRRGVSILRAAEDYCRGCALFELDVADKRQANSDEATTLLDAAAARFEQIGETRWAGYVKGVLYGYEAVICREMARTASPEESHTYKMLAQQRANDAAAQFRQLGLDTRATEMEYWARRSGPSAIVVPRAMTLPKPPPLSAVQTAPKMLVDSTVATESQIGDILLDKGLTKLKATVIAHGRQLAKLEERRDSGALDDARYLALASRYDTERIEQLLEIKKLLEGQGDEVDGIIQDAIDRKPEAELINRIVNLARRKNLNPQIVEELSGSNR